MECTKLNCPMQAGTPTDNCGENCPWRTTVKTGDLILRAAVLEYLDKRRMYEVMNGRNKAYGKGVRDSMKDVDAFPAIDAIPVEWLREKMMNDVCDSELSESAANVLLAWQKEQEERK